MSNNNDQIESRSSNSSSSLPSDRSTPEPIPHSSIAPSASPGTDKEESVSTDSNASTAKTDSKEAPPHVTETSKEDAKIEALKATILELEQQEQEIIRSIRGEGTPEEIIDRHMKDLHRYNNIKDIGQIILGKCAELEGTTIKRQYEKFGLDPED